MTVLPRRPLPSKLLPVTAPQSVNVYYKRNVYIVNFYDRKGKKEYTDLRISAKYGANISKKWPTYNGSNTWYVGKNSNTSQVNIDTMPLGGAKFYGPRTGKGSETAYYYVEVLPGESGTEHNGVVYKEDHRDVSPGKGYTVSKEDQYPITGFTFNANVSTPIRGKYNNAKFYYTRNSYEITFINGGKTEKTESRKYQQNISDVTYTPPDKTWPVYPQTSCLLVGMTMNFVEARHMSSTARRCPHRTLRSMQSGRRRLLKLRFT